MLKKTYIYWSRRDFRLLDNPALKKAIDKCREDNVELLPIFILEEYMTKADPRYQFGLPSRFFLSHALPLFAENFSKFFIVADKPTHFFKKISSRSEIEIFVNEDVHPDFYTQVNKIKELGIKINIFRDQLTIDPNRLTGLGNVYSVFTPFKNAVWDEFNSSLSEKKPSLDNIEYFDLSKLPSTKIIENDQNKIWAEFSKAQTIQIGKNIIDLEKIDKREFNFSLWYKDEAEALNFFKKFLKKNITNYENERDLPALPSTSKMSLALTWGVVSARTLKDLIKKSGLVNTGVMTYISELIWREFYKYLLYHNKKLLDQEFQEKYRGINWQYDREAEKKFISWIEGKTGYPIVDAAMREIAVTGWMHNRSRMIVSSILTKHLGIDWRWGQEYFRAVLIDLDEASNNGGWQWGASVGADPKPIRIFNPYLQAQKYDPDQSYQKKWLDEKYFEEIKEPIIPHPEARQQALKRYKLTH